jgi:hypothetical protein
MLYTACASDDASAWLHAAQHWSETTCQRLISLPKGCTLHGNTFRFQMILDLLLWRLQSYMIGASCSLLVNAQVEAIILCKVNTYILLHITEVPASSSHSSRVAYSGLPFREYLCDKEHVYPSQRCHCYSYLCDDTHLCPPQIGLPERPGQCLLNTAIQECNCRASPLQ